MFSVNPTRILHPLPPSPMRSLSRPIQLSGRLSYNPLITPKPKRLVLARTPPFPYSELEEFFTGLDEMDYEKLGKDAAEFTLNYLKEKYDEGKLSNEEVEKFVTDIHSIVDRLNRATSELGMAASDAKKLFEKLQEIEKMK